MNLVFYRIIIQRKHKETERGFDASLRSCYGILMADPAKQIVPDKSRQRQVNRCRDSVMC